MKPPGSMGKRRYAKKAEKHNPKIVLPALPLGHVGNIAIWEGNYRSDIFNIGLGRIILN
jgi:hypothetical protein